LIARRERVHERNAERLLRGILRMQGVYVKLGQVLSILGGFLPSVYRKKLELLQDRVPPRDFSEMRAVFVACLGRAPEESFESIDPHAIAAASLGQVHVAYLRDHTKVAVKILYPQIREMIAVDLIAVRVAIAVLTRFIPFGNLRAIHDQLLDLLQRETDYVHEAQCMRRLAGGFAGRSDVLFPRVIQDLSGREVLTMTFMDGIKITHLDEQRAAGIDPEAVAKILVQTFAQQLVLDRYFHADPHPGNFFVQTGPTPDQPKLVILDFGAVTEVSGGLIDGMVELAMGFFAQDGAQVLRGFEQMGFIAENGDRKLLEDTVMMYFRRLLKIQHRTPGAILRARPSELRKLASPDMELDELRDLARAFHYPQGWFHVERSLVMMFWLAGHIAPDLDLLQVAFPHVLGLLAQRQAT
jgi:predicted unusual protein kinase regulating ubiquinone biosynthesis (AarF/ABC1/UbiB family)